MPDFDEHNHGIQIMYTDTMLTVEICAHVTQDRAIALLAIAINAVAGKFDMDKQFVIEAATELSNDSMLINRSIRIL